MWSEGVFQYRKRYGLHAMICMSYSSKMATTSFNTASGMDCMQYDEIVEAVNLTRFNTASGMDCMQCEGFVQHARHGDSVSIPQAVWIACNMGTLRVSRKIFRVSIPQAVWIACNIFPVA